MIAAIIIGVFLLVAVILAAVAIPTLRRIKEREQQVALEHLEAVKPKAELTEAEKAAVLAFGEELAGMITSGDAAAVGRMVDVEVFTDLVVLPLGSIKILTAAR